MDEVIRFALLGLGVGALYAFASQGLIVIYRGTGVLNFSLGATAIAGVFAQWELQTEYGWAFLPAAIAGVAWAAFLGTMTHWLIMKPLRRASSSSSSSNSSRANMVSSGDSSSGMIESANSARHSSLRVQRSNEFQ